MTVNYNRDQFLRLVEAVEDAGGKHDPQIHGHTTYKEFTGPIKVKPMTYGGCGYAAQFTVPDLGVEYVVGNGEITAEPQGFEREGTGDDVEIHYGPPVDEHMLQHLGLPPVIEPIKVCAYEDGVGYWPRFKDQVFE